MDRLSVKISILPLFDMAFKNYVSFGTFWLQKVTSSLPRYTKLSFVIDMNSFSTFRILEIVEKNGSNNLTF